MKAITKDGRTFNVRFSKIDIYNFKHHTYKRQWWGKPAEIEIGEVWYNCTIEATYQVDNNEKACCVLSDNACDALGVEPPKDWKKNVCILLDAIPRQEWEEFYETTKKNLTTEANEARFTFIKIRYSIYSESNKIVDWDTSLDKEYADFNKIASELLLMFTLAWKANKDEVSKYIIPGDSVVDYMLTYTVKTSDMERLSEIAKPERIKYEEELRHQEFLAKRKSERDKNIEDGAIYFHCESKPHNEDLSNVILARPCPNGGLFILTHRIDKSVFDSIKEFGVYWDEEFLEDCDMFNSIPGWRFSYHALEKLRKQNRRIFVDYVEVD